MAYFGPNPQTIQSGSLDSLRNLSDLSNTALARTNLSVPSQAEFDKALTTDPESFTPAQQGQARANIAAGVLGGFRNKIINGDFNIWQRGSSVSGTNFYGADRWKGNSASSMTMARGVAGGGTLDEQSEYYLFIGSSSSEKLVSQRIEDVRTLANRKATLTFRVRGNGAYSFRVQVYQDFGSGGSPIQIALNQSIDVTTGFVKHSYTFDIPSVFTKTIGVNSALVIAFGSGGAVPAANSLDLSRVSLVEGDATAEADPFSPRHIQQELALCQRYYNEQIATIQEVVSGAGIVTSALVPFPAMRATPTVAIKTAHVNINTTGVVLGQVYPTGARMTATSGAAGQVVVTATVSADAEL